MDDYKQLEEQDVKQLIEKFVYDVNKSNGKIEGIKLTKYKGKYKDLITYVSFGSNGNMSNTPQIVFIDEDFKGERKMLMTSIYISLVYFRNHNVLFLLYATDGEMENEDNFNCFKNIKRIGDRLKEFGKLKGKEAVFKDSFILGEYSTESLKVSEIMKDLDKSIEGYKKEMETYRKQHDDTNRQTQCSIPLNQILFGPPGTGKTYNTIYKALDILEIKNPNDKPWFEDNQADRKEALEEFKSLKNAGRIVFTTFHQSMSYEDFIEGIKPETKDGNVTYKVKDGIFKEICKKAEKDTNNNYVLIIDEINRGNVARIFGELITLIEDDKRLGKNEALTATLPYSTAKDDSGNEKHVEFDVPKNLYIIGTMNTADRSVEALDSALRRRFSFVEMMPKPELLKKIKISDDYEIDLKSLLETINGRIEILKDREHQIGHSYFMGVKKPAQLKNVMFDKVIPLLQEYFYGDYAKIRMVLGNGFVEENDCKVEFAVNDDDFEKPNKIYTIINKDDVNFNIKEALKEMKI